MTGLACRAPTQNPVRCRYRAPPCPVYARLPPLVHQFPLIIIAKATGAGLITCILVLRNANPPFYLQIRCAALTSLQVSPTPSVYSRTTI
jgi:hypothetical protein